MTCARCSQALGRSLACPSGGCAILPCLNFFPRPATPACGSTTCRPRAFHVGGEHGRSSTTRVPLFSLVGLCWYGRCHPSNIHHIIQEPLLPYCAEGSQHPTNTHPATCEADRHPPCPLPPQHSTNALANASASSTPASPPAALPSAPSRAGSNLSNNTCSHYARAATATTLSTTGTASTANRQSPSDLMPAGILSVRASTGQATFVTDRLHSGTHAALLPTSASCYGLAAAAKAPHKTFLSPRGTADSGSGPRVGFAALASPALSPQAANTVLSPRVTALAAASSRAPSRPSSPRCFAGGDGGSSSSDGGAAGCAAAALQQLLQQHHYAPGPTDRADQQPKVAFTASASAAAAVPRGGGGSGSGSRVSGGGGDVVTGETERPQQGTLGHASLARDRASRLLATMARLRSEGG